MGFKDKRKVGMRYNGDLYRSDRYSGLLNRRWIGKHRVLMGHLANRAVGFRLQRPVGMKRFQGGKPQESCQGHTSRQLPQPFHYSLF